MPDSKDLVRRLRRYSRNAVTNRLDSDFAAAVREAAGILEQLPGDGRSLEHALLLMVVQYCQSDGTLDHQCMSAGEAAFEALGLYPGQNVEDVWRRIGALEKTVEPPAASPEYLPRYHAFAERERKALQKPLNQIGTCTICRELDVKADMIRLGARRGTWGPTRALCYLCQACFARLCEAAGTNPHDYFS